MSTDERPIRPGPAWARTGFLVVVWLLVAGTVVQVFLAGLGVFAGGANFAVHRDFGYMLGLVPIPLFVLSLVGRLPRALVLASVFLFVLFILQSVFVAFRSSTPAVAALHVVNGFLIVLTGIWLGWQARRFAGPPLGTATD
jgi:hypothetical protein